MSGARVLVVDDEQRVRRLLQTALTERGYDVTTAASGEEALSAIAKRQPDIILLDLIMPGMSGLDVCRSVRQDLSTPIVVLSARGEEHDKVLALDLGADDYLTKPFGMEELLARIRVALRHSVGGGSRTEPVYQSGDLRVDFERRRVWKVDVEVRLTPIEYDLLKYFVQHEDRVLTHGMILRALRGPEHHEDSQYLRVFISQLRQKLETDAARPRLIITEPGVGYRFQSQDA
ncbi:MAG TPA: response regulator transcription factor [Chloroflexota bacterium]|jgi:two-component system KDP operon response regulator KdpE